MMFADEKPDFALLPDSAALGFKGAMLDTRDKSSWPPSSRISRSCSLTISARSAARST